MEIERNGYYTMILATLVLLLGRWLVGKIRFLSDFNIPEPVGGGLVAGGIVFLLNVFFGLTFKFQTQLQTAFMLMFFSSIGLSADFTRLRAGGKPLAVFLMVVAVFIVVQNTVGVGLAAALGLDPLIGLVTGSITLTGGHGTAGAWGPVLESKYGITGATTLAMRWLVSFARQRREKTMTERLMNELLDASNGLGASVKRREDTHKMAEANRAFAHYRW